MSEKQGGNLICVLLRAVRGDITALSVDVIVTAANAELRGGGGVDGAVHRAAGPELLAACRGLGGCAPGDAKATPGFGLAARHVIHTVGPVWRGGTRSEADVLASCYRRCLEVADGLAARSIAFPAISTGVYGFPRAEAATIAVTALSSAETAVVEALLVAFDAKTSQLYDTLLSASSPPGAPT